MERTTTSVQDAPTAPVLRTGQLAVAIETMGCKLNQADSDALARQFLAAGCRIAASGEGSRGELVDPPMMDESNCQGA